jgi:hypothetical protein
MICSLSLDVVVTGLQVLLNNCAYVRLCRVIACSQSYATAQKYDGVEPSLFPSPQGMETRTSRKVG